MLPLLGWQGWVQRPEKGSCWTPPNQVNQSQKLSDAPPNSHVPAATPPPPHLALFQDTLFQGLKWRRKKGWSTWGAGPRTRDPGWEGDGGVQAGWTPSPDGISTPEFMAQVVLGWLLQAQEMVLPARWKLGGGRGSGCWGPSSVSATEQDQR